MAPQDSPGLLDLSGERPHWSFDRRVNIGHLFTTLAAVIAIALWASRVETRFTELTLKSDVQISAGAAMTQELKDINSKLAVLVAQSEYQRGLSDARKAK
jgi:hypothetical protein